MCDIKVKEGVLSIDDEEKKVSDLTPEYLEKIFKLALEDKVNFDVDDSTPIALFFKEIQDNTKEDSDFRNKYFETINNIEEEAPSENNVLQHEL